MRVGEKRKKKMKKKKTEKARILAGLDFGKWLFMRGTKMSHKTAVIKQADMMIAYGLEIDVENWGAVREYANDFFLSMRQKIEEEGSK